MNNQTPPRDDVTRSWDAEQRLEKPGMDLRLPSRWRLQRPVGQGGQGQVWLAHDLEADQPVAIKVFDQDLLPAARERLRREVRVGREVHHPNLVALYELVESESNLALVMEWLPGGSLRDAIKKDELSVATVITVTGQILDGLACLHEAGVVHRDIKPSNILLDDQDAARLADFGLVRPTTGGETVTRTATAVGTPTYMSPEQLRGETPAPSSDLYSLGVTLFVLLTGSPPFSGSSEFEIANQHIARPAPDPRSHRPDCPRWFSRFVLRLLEKNPTDRWADAGAARLAFSRRRGLVSPRRWRRAAAIAFALVVGVSLGVVALRSTRPTLVAIHVAPDEVIARDDRGNEMWRRTIPGVVSPALLADVTDDDRPEVVLGINHRYLDGRQTAEIQVLSNRGTELARAPIGNNLSKWAALRVSDRIQIRYLETMDIGGRGRSDIVAVASHPIWFPSDLSVWAVDCEPRPRLLLDNSGHIDHAVAADLDGDGMNELIAAGINNALGYQLFVATFTVDFDREPQLSQQPSSPDQLRTWRDVAGLRTPYSTLRSYTLLGVATLVGKLEPAEDKIVLETAAGPVALDRFGNPLRSAAAGRPSEDRRLLWDHTVELCLRIEEGSADFSTPVADLFDRHGEVLSEDPTHLAVLILLSRSLARAEQPVEAASLLSEFAERHQSSPTFHDRLGHYQALGGDLVGAVESWTRTYQSPTAFGPVRQQAEIALMFLSITTGNRNDFEATGQHLWQPRNRGVDEQARRDLLSLWAFFRGNWNDPSLDFADASPTFPHANLTRAWASLERGRDPAEILQMAESLAGNPEIKIPARLLQAYSLIKSGDSGRAVGLAETVLAEQRAWAREEYQEAAWAALGEWVVGQALIAKGRLEEAQEHIERARSFAPETWFGQWTSES